MPQPDFGGVHAVPVGTLVGLQQKVDGGAACSTARGRIGAPGLAIPAALGVRLQLQPRDDLGRVLFERVQAAVSRWPVRLGGR